MQCHSSEEIFVRHSCISTMAKEDRECDISKHMPRENRKTRLSNSGIKSFNKPLLERNLTKKQKKGNLYRQSNFKFCNRLAS